MNNFINHLEIENFKSIKNMKLDCKRINVFIGKPNVGKSNILEAIGLLNQSMLFSKPNEGWSLRFINPTELHYDNDQNNRICVGIAVNGDFHYEMILFKSDENNDEFDKGVYLIYQQNGLVEGSDHLKPKIRESQKFDLENFSDLYWRYKLNGSEFIEDQLPDSNGLQKELEALHAIKKYEFKDNYTPAYGISDKRLLIPFGSNIFEVVAGIDSLKQKIVALFKADYGLHFVFSKGDQKFFIQKIYRRLYLSISVSRRYFSTFDFLSRCNRVQYKISFDFRRAGGTLLSALCEGTCRENCVKGR